MTLIREYKIGDIIEGKWFTLRFSMHRTRKVPIVVKGKLEVTSYCEARVIEVVDATGDDRFGVDLAPLKAEYEGKIMTLTELETEPWEQGSK